MWRFCSQCGEKYRWQRPAQSRDVIYEGWKQVAVICLIALIVVVMIH